MNPKQSARFVQTTWLLIGMMLVLLQMGAQARAERIKDMATVAAYEGRSI